MSKDAPHILIDRFTTDYTSVIRRGLEWTDVGSMVKWGDSVFVKPNLTFPVYRKGVMTNPECVEAIIVALKDYTNRIVVGEADSGGYNRFAIDSVLQKTGIKDLEQRYGIRVVNLSHLSSRSIEFQSGGHLLEVPLPRMLLDETRLFVSAAVPKIHMYTGVTAAVKNLWGCIPDPTVRLKLHPSLARILLGIYKKLPPSLAVVDGKYGLNRCGPMEGDAVELDWLMIADDLYAADVACCHLMQIDPSSIRYLRYAREEGFLPEVERVKFSQDWRPLVKEKFYLKRRWTDYPGLLAFKSHWLAYVAYYSPAASILHRILYMFRRPFYDYELPDRTTVEPDPSPSLHQAIPRTERRRSSGPRLTLR